MNYAEIKRWAMKVCLAFVVLLLIVTDPPRWSMVPIVFGVMVLVDLGTLPLWQSHQQEER